MFPTFNGRNSARPSEAKLLSLPPKIEIADHQDKVDSFLAGTKHYVLILYVKTTGYNWIQKDSLRHAVRDSEKLPEKSPVRLSDGAPILLTQ